MISETARVMAWVLFGALPFFAFALGAGTPIISALGGLVVFVGLIERPHLGRRVLNLVASARNQDLA